MQQRYENSPLAILVKAIMYFVSGSFVINTMLPRLSTHGYGNLLNWLIDLLTIVVGAIVILAGFLCVVTTLIRHEGFSRWFERLNVLLLLILFPITLPQIVPVLLDFKNLFLSIPAGIFLVLVLIAIVINSWPVIAKNALQLVTLSLALVISVIIRLFQGVDKTEITIFLAVIFVSLIFVLLNLRRKKERQLKLF